MNNEFLLEVFWGNTVKQYVLFISIILLGILFKRVVSRLLSSLLFRLFRKFAADVEDDKFISFLLRPIEFFIQLWIYYVAVNQLSHPLNARVFSYTRQVDKSKILISVDLGQIVDKIFLFLIILSFFWIILRIIDFIAHVLKYKASITENRADDQLVPFLKELTKTVVCFIGFFVLLGYVFEINVLTLITGLGIGGIAVALAAKESLENLIGSFTIFLDKPFTVGDVVKVDGIEGTIDKVGFRSTRIISPDKTTIIIPNRSMIDGVLENVTRRNYQRIIFSLGLSYSTGKDTLKKIVADISALLNNNNQIQDGSARLEALGESSINIQVIYLVPNESVNTPAEIKEEVNYQIIDVIQKNGAEFAVKPIQLRP
ncbi:MAG: mechanosensitive ion channel family protein [Pedobacter sp.]|nr:MAG: mechanosensitive ion channel family protein [Pedobacter sp.]